jgi:hypothetical protein
MEMKFDSVMSRELDATASIDQAKELQVPGGHDVPAQLGEFQKRSQLFIGAHNEALSITAMRVCNEQCLPVGVNR